MAKSVNKVILLGNVGKDPEIRSTPSGTMVATFGLATSDRYQDPQGNWQDRTEWHNLVAFKRTAEIIRDYVKKGSKLYVEGSLRTSNWEDKTSGQKRYKTEIIVSDLSLLSGRDEGSGGYSRGAIPAAPQPAMTSVHPQDKTTWLNQPRYPTTISHSRNWNQRKGNSKAGVAPKSVRRLSHHASPQQTGPSIPYSLPRPQQVVFARWGDCPLSTGLCPLSLSLRHHQRVNQQVLVTAGYFVCIP